MKMAIFHTKVTLLPYKIKTLINVLNESHKLNTNSQTYMALLRLKI
jgi:hypothetical protein